PWHAACFFSRYPMIPGEFLIDGYLRRLGQALGLGDALASTAATDSSPPVDMRAVAPADQNAAPICGGTPINICGGPNATSLNPSGNPLFNAPQVSPNATPLDRALT